MSEIGWKTLSDEDYFADPRINSSTLKDILKGPQYFYKKQKQGPLLKPSDAMTFGSALHLALFFPDSLEKALDTLKTTLKKQELKFCLEAVQDIPFWKDLKKGQYGNPIFEQAGFSEKFKIKPDIRLPDLGVLVDLKTAASLDKFRWAAKDYAYDIQASHYLATANEFDEIHYREFLLIVIEKAQPYRVKLFNFSPDTLARATEKRWEATQKYEIWKDKKALLQAMKEEQGEVELLDF